MKSIIKLSAILIALCFAVSVSSCVNPASKSVPAVPALIEVKAASHTLSLSWNAAERAESYSVYLHTSDDPSSVAASAEGVTGTSYTIANLANDTAYYLWVKAVNANGASAFSASLTGTPVPALPAAPTGLSAQVGPDSITISWSAVEDAASYELLAASDDDSANATTRAEKVTGTSYTLEGLSTGTTLYFWVKAKNSAGASEPSASLMATSMAIPSAPSDFFAVAGYGGISLSWTAVAGAQSYAVYTSTTDELSSAALAKEGLTDTACEVKGLTAGTRYYAWVRAVNAAGMSGFSEGSFATPEAPRAVPDAPTINSGLTALNSTINLSWTEMDRAAGYTVYIGTADDIANATIAVESCKAASCLVRNLTNNTTYYVWVKAVNESGSSPASASVSATPYALAVPAKVSGLSVVASDRQLAVSWSAVASAATYKLFYGTSTVSSQAACYSSSLTATSATMTGLVNGRTYYFWVQAQNAAGIGSLSHRRLGSPKRCGRATGGHPHRPLDQLLENQLNMDQPDRQRPYGDYRRVPERDDALILLDEASHDCLLRYRQYRRRYSIHGIADREGQLRQPLPQSQLPGDADLDRDDLYPHLHRRGAEQYPQRP